MPTVIQANLNRSRPAQDLLLQVAAERDVGVALLSEPHSLLPPHPHWAGSTDGLAAVHWRPHSYPGLCRPVATGSGFVGVRLGEEIYFSIYFSPNRTLVAFERFLSRLETAVRGYLPGRVIVAGDFNAWSPMWGSTRANPRGRALECWAAGMGLVCLNRGSEPTCVRARGASFVDVSWASQAAYPLVRDWRVDATFETLSDHRYITYVVGGSVRRTSPSPEVLAAFPRWRFDDMNRDAFEGVLQAESWAEMEGEEDAGELAARLHASLASACEASMPRVRGPSHRRSTYWWTADIAALRRTCHRCSRALKRHRGRRTPDATVERRLVGELRTARQTLRTAIRVAKQGAWLELLASVEQDPWGRPYLMVLNRLRPPAPPLTESLDPGFLSVVLDTLFPGGDVEAPFPRVVVGPVDAVPLVSDAEFVGAVRRIRSGCVAPGPDGFTNRILGVALPILRPAVQRCFDRCLQTGRFPSVWKRSRLVLLHKPGRPGDAPNSYRPICLLGELGKLLERVIARRLYDHLEQVGPDLHPSQYGFRPRRSTVDAVLALRADTGGVVSRGGAALAVSIDIANAFNSIPWSAIRAAMERRGIPAYLRAIVGDYLRDRSLSYVGRDGLIHSRRVVCGVPQGSVLGPLLWDIAYDEALRADIPWGCRLYCYADDTLLVGEGDTPVQAARRALLGTEVLLVAIRGLGLRVAPEKTEVLAFTGRRRGLLPATVTVSGAVVPVRPYIKYLGIYVDRTWSFRDHFRLVLERGERVRAALSRLMPNLRGPGERRRHLYAMVVSSVVLYGAPVWADDLARQRWAKLAFARLQRSLAARVICAYRTVSGVAAGALAGLPPYDLHARFLSHVYHATRAVRDPGVTNAVRTGARQGMLGRWRARLHDRTLPAPEFRAAMAPVLDRWVDRPRGWQLSYRATQVLTGHGCFGEYLHRIGRAPLPACAHCGYERDTAQHTLADCPAWTAQRCALRAMIGHDLALRSVVPAMLAGADQWRSVLLFCEQVMLAKEAAERAREAAAIGHAPPRRRRRAARRAPRPARLPAT